jgi:hypothetical protein
MSYLSSSSVSHDGDFFLLFFLFLDFFLNFISSNIKFLTFPQHLCKKSFFRLMNVFKNLFLTFSQEFSFANFLFLNF